MEREPTKGAFELGKLVLDKNGTYCVRSTYEGETRTSRGLYEFSSGTLYLEPDGGKPGVYEAKLAALGRELHVMGTEEGSEWTAVMKRCKCGEKCCRCGKCGPMCAKCYTCPET